MLRIQSRSRSQRGAAVVEFALISVLLTTLLFGVMSYGYMLSFRQAISQGAAEGARAAATAPGSFTVTQKETSARNAMNEALRSYGVECNGTTLTRAGRNAGTCNLTVQPCANNAAKDCAAVRIDYAYADEPLIPPVLGVGMVLPEALTYEAVAEVN